MGLPVFRENISQINKTEKGTDMKNNHSSIGRPAICKPDI
jgi:hypothetical protein